MNCQIWSIEPKNFHRRYVKWQIDKVFALDKCASNMECDKKYASLLLLLDQSEK